jgi:septum formation protein
MPAAEVPLVLARKQSAASTLAAGEIVVTADTVVIAGGEILGKPASRGEAIAMLEKLSGRTHTVITGVCVRSTGAEKSFADTTTVTFRPLARTEIEHYVDTFKPFDKAGAYGIQEWIGHVGITAIDGSYNNVVGLPTEKLYLYLQGFFQ